MSPQQNSSGYNQENIKSDGKDRPYNEENDDKESNNKNNTKRSKTPRVNVKEAKASPVQVRYNVNSNQQKTKHSNERIFVIVFKTLHIVMKASLLI